MTSSKSAQARNRTTGGAATKSAVPVTNVDEAIQQARQGRVNVTPAKAVEMAGRLFNEGKPGQAAKVCEQVIAAQPDNADAHNILGVSLNAMGRADEALAELRRAAGLAPTAANILSN